VLGRVGRLVELWRYPVKGLVGESLPQLTLDARGVVGDRAYAVRGADGKFGSANTTRRFRRMPNLLEMRSWTTTDNRVLIETGDGRVGDALTPETAARVSKKVGEPVTLSVEQDVPHLDAGRCPPRHDRLAGVAPSAAAQGSGRPTPVPAQPDRGL
jgi:MOSC domain-containing protein